MTFGEVVNRILKFVYEVVLIHHSKEDGNSREGYTQIGISWLVVSEFVSIVHRILTLSTSLGSGFYCEYT